MAETAPRAHGTSASFDNYDKQMALTHGSEFNAWEMFKDFPFLLSFCLVILLNNFLPVLIINSDVFIILLLKPLVIHSEKYIGTQYTYYAYTCTYLHIAVEVTQNSFSYELWIMIFPRLFFTILG